MQITRNMHPYFRRGILQPLVAQHAKTTWCVLQVTAKEANMHWQLILENMHFCGECKSKGTAKHQKTGLNLKVPPIRNVLAKRLQGKKMTCEIVISLLVTRYIYIYIRRKFGSQTSPTNGKAEVGRVREEKRSEKIREEKDLEERRCKRAKR